MTEHAGEEQADLLWSSEAQKLLANPLLQRFFSETEKSLLEQWRHTEPHDREKREIAWQLLMIADKFKTYFETFLASEEYAAQQLKEMDSTL